MLDINGIKASFTSAFGLAYLSEDEFMEGKEAFCLKACNVFLSAAFSLPPVMVSIVMDRSSDSCFEQTLLLIL